ncbi:MAG: hypothetical protein A2W31_14225 [Planctomycetes bacterium RBG_16_64_10]|nr:MAG: hypothetical protein A2W31_14225 [Planctomycetes bacterium RBG_16_64_10]
MMERAISQLVPVARHEIRAVAWAFAWFFFVLLGQYVLRPVRDTMGIAGGASNLRWLFLATFLAMLIAVPVYALLVARLPRRVLVPVVYRFFTLSLLVFWLMMRLSGTGLARWTAWIFFVWMGVYSLFSVSIFWSFLADVFSSRQGQRLFGLISGGGTLGALCGSLVASQCVCWLGVANLLLIPAMLLELTLICAGRLGRLAGQFDPASHGAGEPEPTGGGMLAGITSILRSRYLFGISGYLFLATFSGTIVYCQQAEIVQTAIGDDVGRTRLFAEINLAVQVLTFGLQTFVTARIIRGFGLPATLCLLPVLSLVGFAMLGVAPVLAVLVVVEIARRVTIYGIAEPARVVLFTVVTREEKYKTKSFIDTVVFRGGDAVAGQFFAGLRGLGLGLAAIAWVMLPVAIVWTVLGWILGRHELRLAHARSPQPD